MNMKFVRTFAMLALTMVIGLSVTGGTIAWFTDSVTNTGNTIESGNLDMEVSYKPYGTGNWAETDEDGNGVWAEVEKDTKLFKQGALYEPGYTEAFWLKIQNVGNLAFKYQAALDVLQEKDGVNKAGESFNLSKYLYVNTYVLGADETFESIESSKTTRDGVVGLFTESNAKALESADLTMNTGVLNTEGDTAYVLVMLQMPTTVGNEANYQGNDVPVINLGLNVVATQQTYESDAFDNSYDADATYPEGDNGDNDDDDGEPENDLPQAILQKLEGDNLNIVASDDYNGFITSNYPNCEPVNGPKSLDYAVKMTAPETPDAVANSPYAYYYVDLELTVSKDLSETDDVSHVMLAGHYDWEDLGDNGEWIAFNLKNTEVKANEPIRVMQSLAGNRINYTEVLESIKQFSCGIKLLDKYFNGETVTLELCMYNNHTDEKYVLASYTYDCQYIGE